MIDIYMCVSVRACALCAGTLANHITNHMFLKFVYISAWICSLLLLSFLLAHSLRALLFHCDTHIIRFVLLLCSCLCCGGFYCLISYNNLLDEASFFCHPYFCFRVYSSEPKNDDIKIVHTKYDRIGAMNGLPYKNRDANCSHNYGIVIKLPACRIAIKSLSVIQFNSTRSELDSVAYGLVPASCFGSLYCSNCLDVGSGFVFHLLKYKRLSKSSLAQRFFHSKL